MSSESALCNGEFPRIAREIWVDFNAVPILWRPTGPLADRGLELALTEMVSVYDAIYLKAAEEAGAAVVSADAGMVANGARLGRAMHLRDYGQDTTPDRA